jgi:phytoene dehydrogenase-like protein
LEIVLPSNVDASAAPPGYFTVELMRLAPPEDMAGWFDDASAFDPVTQRQSAGYQTRKALAADQMIDAAEALIPGLRARTVFRREASPVTFRRYGYNTHGAVYGAQGPDGRLGPLPRRSPVPGLVFAGAAAMGPGVEPAMMSGAEAADALWPGLLRSTGCPS